MNVSATYALDVSYTLFKDILLFMNDTLGVGNYFVPVYDDGTPAQGPRGDDYPLNSQLTLVISTATITAMISPGRSMHGISLTGTDLSGLTTISGTR